MNNISFIIIIPARLASTRLPQKLILDLGGKPVIERVYENALTLGANRVIIATDSEKIENLAKTFGAEVILTDINHLNGTERLAEVVNFYQFPDETIIVNVQGDEPLISRTAIQSIVKCLANKRDADMATACVPITDVAEIFNPNCVKVIFNEQGLVHYFSRAPIPWDRSQFNLEADKITLTNAHFRHIGLYAYKAKILNSYKDLKPSLLEQIEILEQLRFLENGKNIYIEVLNEDILPGIDTLEDLETVRLLY
ncbi:MAG: 3-deoxy-manno-octulosonate cytidylyltransferase [Francisellaceae bacterium]|nr:3-deoxy-manno-octulosonate cytidylyltransferase [Francisellaceae bacterium]